MRLIFLILIPFFSPVLQAVADGNDTRNYGSFFHSEETPNTLYFFDEIRPGDSFELRKALRNHDIQTLVLDSPGGVIFEGLQLAAIIKDKKLSTYVPSQEVTGGMGCLSACSFMFFAGESRKADGLLGVHQFWSNETFSSEDIQFTVSEIIGFLKEFNAPDFVLERMFQQSEMYYFTKREVGFIESSSEILDNKKIEKINEFIVTSLKSPNVFELNLTRGDLFDRLEGLQDWPWRNNQDWIIGSYVSPTYYNDILNDLGEKRPFPFEKLEIFKGETDTGEVLYFASTNNDPTARNINFQPNGNFLRFDGVDFSVGLGLHISGDLIAVLNIDGMSAVSRLIKLDKNIEKIPMPVLRWTLDVNHKFNASFNQSMKILSYDQTINADNFKDEVHFQFNVDENWNIVSHQLTKKAKEDKLNEIVNLMLESFQMPEPKNTSVSDNLTFEKTMSFWNSCTRKALCISN